MILLYIFTAFVLIALFTLIRNYYVDYNVARINDQTISIDDDVVLSLTDFPFAVIINVNKKRRYRKFFASQKGENLLYDIQKRLKRNCIVLSENNETDVQKANKMIQYYAPWINPDENPKLLQSPMDIIQDFVHKNGIKRSGIIYLVMTDGWCKLMFTPLSAYYFIAKEQIRIFEQYHFFLTIDPKEYNEYGVEEYYNKIQRRIIYLNSLVHFYYNYIRSEEFRDTNQYPRKSIPSVDEDTAKEMKQIKEEIKKCESQLDELEKRIAPIREDMKKLTDYCEEANKLCHTFEKYGLAVAIKIGLLDKNPKLSSIDISVVNGSPVVRLPLYHKTISMPSLSLTLLIFYLRHTGGVKFKDLSDYRDELLDIYKAVSARTDIEQLKRSIYDLLDPTSNSLNEKCARLKAAFCQTVDDSIARNYYITGPRSGLRRITLPPELININI